MKKGDYFVLAAVVIIAAAGFFIGFLQASKDAGTVTVTVDGELFGEYPLDKDAEITVNSPDGVNVLIIKNGKADVISADCPGGDCVSQRAIGKNGEMIVCLPHKVIITVTSTTTPKDDIVA